MSIFEDPSLSRLPLEQKRDIVNGRMQNVSNMLYQTLLTLATVDDAVDASQEQRDAQKATMNLQAQSYRAQLDVHETELAGIEEALKLQRAGLDVKA